MLLCVLLAGPILAMTGLLAYVVVFRIPKEGGEVEFEARTPLLSFTFIRRAPAGEPKSIAIATEELVQPFESQRSLRVDKAEGSGDARRTRTAQIT